jgi:adenosine/AMP kinase
MQMHGVQQYFIQQKEREQKIRAAVGCVDNKTSRRIDTHRNRRQKREKKAGHKK